MAITTSGETALWGGTINPTDPYMIFGPPMSSGSLRSGTIAAANNQHQYMVDDLTRKVDAIFAIVRQMEHRLNTMLQPPVPDPLPERVIALARVLQQRMYLVQILGKRPLPKSVEEQTRGWAEYQAALQAHAQALIDFNDAIMAEQAEIEQCLNHSGVNHEADETADEDATVGMGECVDEKIYQLSA